uniref:Ubiquitin carboxyl-terminal hydrolase n=1 Tax=Neospora caninum (strain Liverpool) TaxID=572307 RepID=A0A0F7UEI9_NEOCL|nr:TPA: ubiquitin carboxyl-terminal hydrolase [Neospora caninum Liverpool]
MESRIGQKGELRNGKLTCEGSDVAADLSNNSSEIVADANGTPPTVVDSRERYRQPVRTLQERLGSRPARRTNVDCDDCGGDTGITNYQRTRVCSPKSPEPNGALRSSRVTGEMQHEDDGEGGKSPERIVNRQNDAAGVVRSGQGEDIQEPWYSLLTPFPPFLISLWARQLQLQQAALDKGLLPLPLHNPSSFCFLSASLQALASLTPLLHLLHGLTYLRLLRQHLDGSCTSSPFPTSLPAPACQPIQSGVDVGRLRDEAHATRQSAYSHPSPTPCSRRARAVSPSFQQQRSQLVDGPRQLPHILLACLLNLDRGLFVPSLSALLASHDLRPCKGPGSSGEATDPADECESAGNAATTPGDTTGLASHPREGKEGCAARDNFVGRQSRVPEWCLDSSSAGAPSSLLDLLRRLELSPVPPALPSAKTLDPAEACPNSLDKNAHLEQTSECRDGLVQCRRCVDIHEALARVRAASLSSSATLERERLQIVRAHQGKATTNQHGMAAAVYREICNAARHRLPGDLGIFGEATSNDMFMREQDAHEFLQALLEELDENCRAAGDLCSQLSGILENALAYISTDPGCRGTERRHDAHRQSRSRGRKTLNGTPDTRLHTDKDDDMALQDESGAHRAEQQIHDVTPGLATERDMASGSGPSASPQKQKATLADGRHPEAALPHLTPPRMTDVFSGSIAEFTRCLVCGYCTPERVLPFSCLQLSLGSACESRLISNLPSIQELLRSTLGPQRVQSVECLFCSAVATLKRLQLRLRSDPFLVAFSRFGGACSGRQNAEAGDFGLSRDGREGGTPEADTVHRLTRQSTSPGFKDILGSLDDPCVDSWPASATTGSADPGMPFSFDKRLLSEPRIPGLFSSVWSLPASLIRGYVHRWALVGQLTKFFALRGGLKTTDALTEERRPPAASQGMPQLRHSEAVEPGSKTHTVHAEIEERALDALKLRAGGLWAAVRRSKEKVQRLQQLPQVLIIQISSLGVTAYGQVYKQLERCTFPLVLDALSLLGPAGDNVNGSHAHSFNSSDVCELPPQTSPGMLSSETQKRGVVTNSTTCDRGICPAAGWGCESAAETNADLQQEKLRTRFNGPLYELRAVISHLGCSASSGHFVCYRRWDARAFGPGPGARSLVKNFCATPGVRTLDASAVIDSSPPGDAAGHHGNAGGCELEMRQGANRAVSMNSPWDHAGTSGSRRRDSESAARVLVSATEIEAKRFSRGTDDAVRCQDTCAAGGEGDSFCLSCSARRSEETTQRKGIAQCDKPGSPEQGEALRARTAWTKARQDMWLRQSTILGASAASFVRVSDSCVRVVGVDEVMATAPYLLFYQVASPAVF